MGIRKVRTLPVSALVVLGFLVGSAPDDVMANAPADALANAATCQAPEPRTQWSMFPPIPPPGERYSCEATCELRTRNQPVRPRNCTFDIPHPDGRACFGQEGDPFDVAVLTGLVCQRRK